MAVCDSIFNHGELQHPGRSLCKMHKALCNVPARVVVLAKTATQPIPTPTWQCWHGLLGAVGGHLPRKGVCTSWGEYLFRDCEMALDNKAASSRENQGKCTRIIARLLMTGGSEPLTATRIWSKICIDRTGERW